MKKFLIYLSSFLFLFGASTAIAGVYIEDFEDGVVGPEWQIAGSYVISDGMLHMNEGDGPPYNISWVRLSLQGELVYHFEADIKVQPSTDQMAGIVVQWFEPSGTGEYGLQVHLKFYASAQRIIASLGSFTLGGGSGPPISAEQDLGPGNFNEVYSLSITLHDSYITFGINGIYTDLFHGQYRNPTNTLEGEGFVHGHDADNIEDVDYYVDNIKAYSRPPDPKITVTHPNGGEVLTKGRDYTIAWDSAGDVSGNILIHLYKGGTDPAYFVAPPLASNASNDGAYPFNPPDTLADGNDYYIGISAEGGTIWDFSNAPFTIQTALPPDNIYIEDFEDGVLGPDPEWYSWGPYEIIAGEFYVDAGLISGDNVHTDIEVGFQEELIYHFAADVKVSSSNEQGVGLHHYIKQAGTGEVLWHTELIIDTNSSEIIAALYNGVPAVQQVVGTANLDEWNSLSITLHDDYIAFEINGVQTNLFKGTFQKPSSLLDLGSIAQIKAMADLPNNIEFQLDNLVLYTSTDPNQPPIIDYFNVMRNCFGGLLSVRFDCLGYDPDGESVEYTINYGDGNPPEINGTGIFYHEYPERSTYSVTCTVEDDESATSTSGPTRYGENENHTGPIDVPVDSDDDELSDCWEIYGYDHNGDGIIDVDLPAMGADPAKKDVFVEIDYTYDDERKDEDKPKLQAIKKIVDSFKEQGINLHVDAGSSFPMDPQDPFNKTWGFLSKSNSILHPGVPLVVGTTNNADVTKFNQLIDKHFLEERQSVFHYCIFSHEAVQTDGKYPSGYTDQEEGGYFIVSLYNHTVTKQAGTFMHELGHSLGLGPDGAPVDTYNPNYLSVMNYSFQFDGLTINGKGYNFDYSRFKLHSLDEWGLDEQRGLTDLPVKDGRNATFEYDTIYYLQNIADPTNYFTMVVSPALATNSSSMLPVDWDFDQQIDTNPIELDINKDGNKTILDGYNDWINLNYKRGGTGAFGAIELPPDIIPIEDAIIEEITEDQIENMKHDYAVSLDISATELICPGATYIHSFALENTGENPDTYSLSADSALGWSDLSSLPYTVSLNPGAKMVFAIPINVPLSANPDEEERLNILATSHANDNLADSAEIVVKVLTDIEAPDISPAVSPDTLWPPDHKMRPVTVTAGVSDNCDPEPICLITAVSSNEPIDGLGDGDTAPDWEITGDLTVNLRAERAGTGTGRVYTITVECTDASGNTATADVIVTVLHDQQ